MSSEEKDAHRWRKTKTKKERSIEQNEDVHWHFSKYSLNYTELKEITRKTGFKRRFCRTAYIDWGITQGLTSGKTREIEEIIKK